MKRPASPARPLATTLLVGALTAALALPLASAQDARLPELGSSAGTVLGPAEQREYGEMTLAQLRNLQLTLEDPLLSGWLRTMGNRLAAASDRPQQDFTLFLLRERQINAFATLGGYIGVNAGLVLAADSEDEVASVLSHEIAHVTQSHVLRGVERAQRDSIPILLAMLGAIVVAQKSGGSSSGDATMAAISAGQGLLYQRMIDYTRSNESEADRIGIRTLANAGYAPAAMGDFFAKLQTVVRASQGQDSREQTPDYLQTHPVTLTRISEARERAAKLGAPPAYAAAASTNPLLPGSLRVSAGTSGNTGQFAWARERLRVLSAASPAAAVREYEQRTRSGALDDPQRYGLAYARLLDGRAAEAASELQALAGRQPDNAWVALALAQAWNRSGRGSEADALFDRWLERMPGNRAVILAYAQALAERNQPAEGKRAQALLRPLLGGDAARDPAFQQTFARVSEIAGDPVRAGEAWAEAADLNGRPEQALVQLGNLKKRSDLDYYARARIDARIAAITPKVLELRRQGIKDEELGRR